jgi:LacI family transcriptional regulator
MNKPTCVTLQAVADAAGLSRATVSRALRHHPAIPADTRARVSEIAKKLGLNENPILSEAMRQVRSRRSQNKEVVAFLTSHSTRDGWREYPTYRQFFSGAEARAREVGLHLEPIWARETGMTGKRLSRVLTTRSIRGLIVAPLPEAVGRIELDWSFFCAATLGNSLTDPKIHRAVHHQFHGIRTALNELDRRGYARLGLALSEWFDDRADNCWTAGYRVWQARQPVRSRIPILLPPEVTEPLLKEWVRRYRPNVIIGSGRRMLEAILHAGWRVPEDISYVNLDVAEDEGWISGVIQNSTQAGAAAVELVVEQFIHGRRGVPEVAKTVLIEGTWNPGTTLAPGRGETTA